MSASQDELVPALQKLGLNLYESRAFLALAVHRELTAKELGQLTTIPQSRTYDVLEELKDKGMVLATPTPPKRYRLLDPRQILRLRYERSKKELQAPLLEKQEQVQQKLDALQENYSKLLTQLTGLEYRPPGVTEPVWVIEGKENIERTIVALVQKAQKEFLRITRPPGPYGSQPFDPFYLVGMERWKAVYDAVSRGVVVKWLTLAGEVPTYIGLEVVTSPERRFLEQEEELQEKFLLVDGTTVLLNLRDPATLAFASQALLIESPAIAQVFKSHFDVLWARAKPVGEIIAVVRNDFRQLVRAMKSGGFDEEDVHVYSTLVNVGAMHINDIAEQLSSSNQSPEDVRRRLSKLAKEGFVHENRPYHIYFPEQPSRLLEKLKTSSTHSENPGD